MLKIIATAKTKNKIYASAKVDGKIEASVRFPSIVVPQKSGIAYAPRGWSGQTISYRMYDEGWRWQHGGFEINNPINPLYLQSLDYSSGNLTTLKFPNKYGDFNRFTDLEGGQDYSDRSFIDHLYGMLVHERPEIGIPFDQIFSDIATFSYKGITDWSVITLQEWLNFYYPQRMQFGPLGFYRPGDLSAEAIISATSFARSDWWVRIINNNWQSSGIARNFRAVYVKYI